LFDIGFQELIVIFIVALLVVGPKRLPELARTVGKRLGEFKRVFENVKARMNVEMKELEREEQAGRPNPDSSPAQNISVKTEVTAVAEES
jgi:Tat protein translocase TatB subunit